MKKAFKPLLSLLISGLAFSAQAQTANTEPTIQPFGKVDTADLRLTGCDFEKDANAMVLFDKATVSYKYLSVIVERHKRVKIFNDNGKSEADFRLEFYGVDKDEEITNLEAETINLDGDHITYIPVDAKSIYTQVADKDSKVITFSFPAIKAGSIIEFKYKKTTPYPRNYPDWYFQTDIPTRYSEMDATFLRQYDFTIEKRVFHPMTKDTGWATTGPLGSHYIWRMKNIASYKKEPFVDYPDDYTECILINTTYGQSSWDRIGNGMLGDDDFGMQLNKKLAGQDQLISHAGKLKTDKEKIAYLFDTVRNAMKWDKRDSWYCIDGVKKAWEKGTGNSTEINLVLYNLLAAANVNAFLLGIRTRESGRLDENYATWHSINKVVVYAQADSSTYYVLDASDKLNTYDNVPGELSGLRALKIAATNKVYQLISIPAGTDRVTTLINGEILPDGKLNGTSQVSDVGYTRKAFLKEYNESGEKKYIESLEKGVNGLKIISMKVDNVQNDSIPLTRTITFNYSLAEPDGDYMYFNPHFLTGFNENPFLAEKRISDIDFGSFTTYSINGRYKMPAGYKADVLPQSINMQMPDKGIVFKRVIAAEDGYILVHYVIDFKKPVYSKNDYDVIRNFYKKMFELMNEQIVLKKA